jgi:glutamate--cysteine ligase
MLSSTASSPCCLELSLFVPYARQVLAIAQGGLDRRGYDEGHFLKQLHVIVDSGLCQASHLLELYGTSWGNSVDPLFKEFMY